MDKNYKIIFCLLDGDFIIEFYSIGRYNGMIATYTHTKKRLILIVRSEFYVINKQLIADLLNSIGCNIESEKEI